MNEQIALEMGDDVERRLEGTVVRVIFRSGDGKFGVAKIDVGGEEEIVVGPLPGTVSEGQSISALGRPSKDPKFGLRFKASLIEIVMPTNVAGIQTYLASGVVFGIGEGLARRIVERLGEETLDRIVNEPGCLDGIQGLSTDRAAMLAQVVRAQQVEARTLSFLHGFGLGPALARRVFLEWKEHTINRVQQNPYDLALEISGIGFTKADEIGRRLGIPRNSPFRARAAVIHWLEESSAAGHVYLSSGQLIDAIDRALGLDPALLTDAILDMEAAKRIVIDVWHGEVGQVELIYLARLHRDEVAIAAFLARLLQTEDPTPIAECMSESLEETMATVERELGIELAGEQREAVSGAIEGKVMVVTGGPGSGKCLGRGTPVMLHDGRIVPVEQVVVGDRLMGPDGSPRVVLSTTSGRGPLFQIAPRKGDPWVCNDVHVLTLRRSTGYVIDIPLNEYLRIGYAKRSWRLFREPTPGTIFRVGFSVYPIGDGEYFGFELDGDGRFLLGDFTVTHNTTLIRAVARTLQFAHKHFALAAPTGRAARRMEMATGRGASTIHRLLEYDLRIGGFKRNAKNPLSADWVVIDEQSMVCVPLMRSLLAAITPTSHLVLVGDIDQLPSVGPGAVLASVIQSGAVPVVRLTKIFRQAAESGIVMNAHRVNHGKAPWEDGVEWPDFEIEDESDAEVARDRIVALVADELPDRFRFDPFTDIQVLTPMRRGSLGVGELNAALRARLNPHGEEIPGPVIEGSDGRKISKFRDGDRVMQTVNDYPLDVMNGECGVIDGLEEDGSGKVRVKFDDREICYSRDQLFNLELAYACSTHKSQGGEFPCVVIAMHTQHYVMLKRNLLYTAITRGKRHVVLVGSRRAMAIAARQEDTQRRNTILDERIRQAMR